MADRALVRKSGQLGLEHAVKSSSTTVKRSSREHQHAKAEGGNTGAARPRPRHDRDQPNATPHDLLSVEMNEREKG